MKINNQRGYGSIIVFFLLILVAVLIYNSQKSSIKDVKSPEFNLMEGDTTFSLNLATTKLGTIPENYQFNEYDVVFSPDGKRFATKINEWNKIFAFINGQLEKKYDKSENGASCRVLFSPNGKHFAYRVKEGNEFIVFDGLELKKYSWAGRDMVFSSDSKQFAYTAGNAGKWFVVLNGREGEKYNEVSSPVFSPDSKQSAYIVGTKYGKFAILNGRRGKLHDQIYGLTFSPDSKQLAYAVREGARTSSFVVLNDREGKRYDSVDERIVFSPDSKQLAYVAEENGKRFVVINGQEGKRYAYVNGHSSKRIVFSSDSSQFFYIARDEGFNEFLVLNGEEQRTCKNIIFAPDGKSIFKMEDKRIYVVMNGQQIDLPKYSSNFIFSPDSTKFAYIAKDVNKFGSSDFSAQEFDAEKFKNDLKNGRGIANTLLAKLGIDISHIDYVSGQQLVDKLKNWHLTNEDVGEFYDMCYGTSLRVVLSDVLDAQQETISEDTGMRIKQAMIQYYYAQETQKSQQFIVVNNDWEMKRYDYIYTLTFSPDGKYLCYGARDGRNIWWVVEEVK